ncbi:MAG: MarR family transcriptional regulator [Caldilineales bacterium]|nr:MarR family transcriptional regulator [Caldilineales bacterium]
MKSTHQSHLQELLAEHDIHETYGVEVMRMVRMLSNIYEAVVGARLRESDLSGPRWRILLHLYMSEMAGQPSLSPGELSRMQRVTKNTISSLLRSLEEQSLIERTLDPVDRRQFQIRLTPSGREFVRTITPGHVAFLNSLISDLSAAEVSQLLTLLDKLHLSLAHHGDLPDVYCRHEQNAAVESAHSN